MQLIGSPSHFSNAENLQIITYVGPVELGVIPPHYHIWQVVGPAFSVT
jgi:hypothetical protein